MGSRTPAEVMLGRVVTRCCSGVVSEGVGRGASLCHREAHGGLGLG